MLPNLHRDRYQNFLLILEQLQQIVSSASSASPLSQNQDKAVYNLDHLKLRQDFAQLQPVYLQEIANLSLDNLDPPIASRLQSYLTEINKQLQLLAIDITFLQASRQPTTLQARITQINTRLQTLISYVKAILQ